jgi:hypothetical protein
MPYCGCRKSRAVVYYAFADYVIIKSKRTHMLIGGYFSSIRRP